MNNLDCLSLTEISREDALSIDAGNFALFALGAIGAVYSATYYIGYAAGATVAFVEDITKK